MSKLIETTFSLGGYDSIKQGRRILIIRNQSGFVAAANLIVEKRAAISCVNRTTTRQSSSSPQSISKEGVAMSSQVAAENLTTAQSPHAEADRNFYYEKIYHFVGMGFLILAQRLRGDLRGRV